MVYVKPFGRQELEILGSTLETFCTEIFKSGHNGAEGSSVTDSSQPFHEE
jgi:hypothetical protein